MWVLGSGSRGNALLLESGDARVLVDAGFAPRVLQQRLRAVGVEPGSIAACLVTHEHGDHVKGAAAAAERWGWTLHASEGTAGAFPELRIDRLTSFAPGDTVELPGFTMQTLASSHDAAAPVVLVATARDSGVRTGIAYDLGHVSGETRAAFRELDVLVLESNHDEGMLWAGPYPPSVRKRIASRTGHLSNRAAGLFARECAHGRLAHVVLAHLSEKCNDHGVALANIRGALAPTAFRGQAHTALQHAPVGPFTARTSRTTGPAQLALAL